MKVGLNYDRRTVEALLPAVWDREAAYGMKNEEAPDSDMPRAKTNPKQANALWAHLADIRAAWAWAERGGVSLDEARALLLRHGLDLTLEEIALREGANKSTIARRVERGVGKIAAHLNGVAYVDGYDEVVDAA